VLIPFLSAVAGKHVISAFNATRKFLEVAPISVRLGGGQSLYVSLLQGKLMRSIAAITLFLCAALAVTSIDAAWYQKTDGTIVNPILDTGGNPLQYFGGNLEPDAILQTADLRWASLPYANLTDADLSWANLTSADLTSADLTDAALWHAHLTELNLTDANLWHASLNGSFLNSANLTGANLTSAQLFYVDLTDANLSGSILTDVQYYNDADWTDAFYYTDNEPTWRSGMNAAWRSSAGILALAPTSAVPEPAAMLLALLGLALLPRRRRR
jgi:hypothetical protein